MKVENPEFTWGALDSLLKEANTQEDCVDVVRRLKEKRGIKSSSSNLDNGSTRELNNAKSIVSFLDYGSKIKETKRTGWLRMGLEGVESVADHMYKMGLMCLVLPSPHVNMHRCLAMAIVHDLAESIVGDITPECGVSKQDKHEMEFLAMIEICRDIGGKESNIFGLWREYESAETAESKYVHELDKLEFALQNMYYERERSEWKCDRFMEAARLQISHPFLIKVFEAVMEKEA